MVVPVEGYFFHFCLINAEKIADFEFSQILVINDENQLLGWDVFFYPAQKVVPDLVKILDEVKAVL
jgi:hypothetical protein